MIIPLPEATQTLQAELRERLLAEAARRSVGKAPGTFTTKALGGREYVYFQYSQPGGGYRQLYIGKNTDEVARLVKRFEKEKPDAEREREDIERLCAQTLAGAAWSMGSGPARVLKAFAEAGVFDAGAVLVGTHAFGVIGNMLGVRWASSMRTEDVDVAAFSLVARGGQADAAGALERLGMGFLPVPRLDPRHPSTSFKVRGRSLRVDFLTPGKEGPPVSLPALATSAQPLPYLDYLIEDPEKAAVLDNGGFLTLVPSPARFALHKILISSLRPAAESAKSAKDLSQAAQLLQHLEVARPGDITLAWEELTRRRWGARLGRGLKRLVSEHPQTAAAARRLVVT